MGSRVMPISLEASAIKWVAFLANANDSNRELSKQGWLEVKAWCCAVVVRGARVGLSIREVGIRCAGRKGELLPCVFALA